MSANHPYKKLERHRAWKALDKAIDDLAANEDLEELTAHRYIVGYLLEQLLEANLLAKEKNVNGSSHRSALQSHHRLPA